MKIQNSSYAGVCSTVKRLCVSHVWYRYCDGFGPTYTGYIIPMDLELYVLL